MVCVVAHGIAVADGLDAVIVFVGIAVRLYPITSIFIGVAIASRHVLFAALVGGYAVGTTRSIGADDFTFSTPFHDRAWDV